MADIAQQHFFLTQYLPAFPQQFDDGLTPVCLDDLLFEVNRPSDTMLKIYPAAGHGQMNMWVPVKLSTIGV